jgi:hypothetical protein
VGRFGGTVDPTKDGTCRKIDRWIECECPVTALDFVINEDDREFRSPDAVIECFMCREGHRLGDIAQFLVRDRGHVSRLTDDQWRMALTITEPPTFEETKQK